jgi:hypothetical protein
MKNQVQNYTIGKKIILKKDISLISGELILLLKQLWEVQLPAIYTLKKI